MAVFLTGTGRFYPQMRSEQKRKQRAYTREAIQGIKNSVDGAVGIRSIPWVQPRPANSGASLASLDAAMHDHWTIAPNYGCCVASFTPFQALPALGLRKPYNWSDLTGMDMAFCKFVLPSTPASLNGSGPGCLRVFESMMAFLLVLLRTNHDPIYQAARLQTPDNRRRLVLM